jgi:hypothetical protein
MEVEKNKKTLKFSNNPPQNNNYVMIVTFDKTDWAIVAVACRFFVRLRIVAVISE